MTYRADMVREMSGREKAAMLLIILGPKVLHQFLSI